MDNNTFFASMAYLQKLYGKQLDNKTLSMYSSALNGMSDDDFKCAMENIVRTFIPSAQCPLPVPAHFYQLKIKGVVGRIKSAIRRIGRYRSISFCDYAAHEAIKQVGGWVKMCEYSNDWWDINQKRFEELYEACQVTNSKIDHLPGITENDSFGHYHISTVDVFGNMQTDKKMIPQNNTDLIEDKTLEDKSINNIISNIIGQLK